MVALEPTLRSAPTSQPIYPTSRCPLCFALLNTTFRRTTEDTATLNMATIGSIVSKKPISAHTFTQTSITTSLTSQSLMTAKP